MSRKVEHRYFLRFGGAPLCDCLGRPDLRHVFQEAGVNSCSYPNLAAARKALAGLEAVAGYEGSAQVAEGRCPRLDENYGFDDEESP